MDSPVAAIRTLIAGVLTEIDKDRVRSDTKIRTLQAEGFRIVDGGPEGGRDDPEGPSWRVLDWHTREVLAEGVGLDSYEATNDDTWYHIDHVDYGDKFFAAVTELKSASGLPESLADAITEWAETYEEDAVELRNALPQRDAVTNLVELGASHGYGINFQRVSEDGHWQVGWTRGRHGGWFGFTADDLAEAAREAAENDLPKLLAEHANAPS